MTGMKPQRSCTDQLDAWGVSVLGLISPRKTPRRTSFWNPRGTRLPAPPVSHHQADRGTAAGNNREQCFQEVGWVCGAGIPWP